MTEPVWIIGVSMTPFGVHATSTATELAQSAVREALADADLDARAIQAAFFGSTTQGVLHGQHMIAGQIALRPLGLERLPIYNVENACATGASALNLAINHVRAGAADTAVAVGVEKMNIDNPTATMAVFDGAYDVADPGRLRAALTEIGGQVDDADLGQRSIFMDIYAAWARAHMDKYGTTQRQIAAVAAKNHQHAVTNDKAHYRKAMTIEQVLAGRALSYPLTVPMCAPITDGAAAAIVCNQTALQRVGSRRPVRVLASVVGTGQTRDTGDYDTHVTRLVAQRAFHNAGIDPREVSVAEVHDATAFAEILLSELLGLFDEGEGGEAAEKGLTSLGGGLPINPSGGLESKGHPLAATGLAQIYELVHQLRKTAGGRQVEDARVAVAENGGGFYAGEEAVAAVTILGR